MTIVRAALAVALAIAPLGMPRVVEAQLPAGKARIGILRIGVLLTSSPPGDVALRLRDGLRAGLRQAGYVEGRDVTIEERNAEGNVERLRDLATELIQLRVVVIVTFGTPAALAAKAATTSIPIVATSVGDPLGSGLIRSLAGPNGNITGVTNLSRELSAKRFQLLKEVFPTLSRVTAIWDATASTLPGDPYGRRETEEAGRRLGLSVQMLPVHGPSDFVAAFEAAVKWHAEALLVLPSPVLPRYAKPLVELAATHKLPAMYQAAYYTDAGGLMAYGPSPAEEYSSAAVLVSKILRGVQPANLPFNQPTKFELFINLKTAKALGLMIPPSLLLRADQIIE